MSVENPDHQQAAPSEAPAQPPLLKLDFSSNPALRQVATTLRRVWLLDPPLSHEERADHATAQACFRDMCETVGSGLPGPANDDGNAGPAAEASSEWDHGAWLAGVAQQRRLGLGLRLVEAPVVAAAAASPDPRSVVSPWREEIYDVYRHVFADLWRGLEATAVMDPPPARYDPSRGDAVSLVVLPVSGVAEEAQRTAFRTDTFLYPVWVNPRAEISFSAAAGGNSDGIEHRWVDGEEATWITGLWVRGGEDVVLTTKMDGAGDDETGVAAVFVTGHCDERDDSAPIGTYELLETRWRRSLWRRLTHDTRCRTGAEFVLYKPPPLPFNSFHVLSLGDPYC